MEKSAEIKRPLRFQFSRWPAFVLIIILTGMLHGCGSIPITDYIPSTHDPYKRKYYSDFKSVVETVKDVLKQNEWTIAAEDDPSVYERRSPSNDAQAKSVVLFTDIRSNWRLIYARHTHMNVFIFSDGDTTEVDVRYSSQIATVFRQFHRYRNDKLIRRILDKIEESLLIR